ncbi:intraflagellar transport-associated protein isoform X2 [Aotus nancymaae]|uniref:intraflagellar transport-associated protein isoform X2 n=1 Tax=Aotus nancymaae TaxID=37293 RepID=UPI0030FEF138
MSGLKIMDEDQLIEEVLDKFLNCHEETYDEEFLDTFTNLSQEDHVSKRGVFETDSSENMFISAKVTHKNEANDYHLRNKTIFLHTSSQCLEKQVDSFLDLEVLDMDEEIKPQMSQGHFFGLLKLVPSLMESISVCHDTKEFFKLSASPSSQQGLEPAMGLKEESCRYRADVLGTGNEPAPGNAGQLKPRRQRRRLEATET